MSSKKYQIVEEDLDYVLDLEIPSVKPLVTPSVAPELKLNEKDDFEKKITDYFVKNRVKLYILTPCYGGVCNVNYTHSLIQTVILFGKLGISLQIEFCKNDSLVPRARNNLIARAMANPEMTHCLFIDSDITWNAVDILKLIISGKDLVGGVYPLKHYCWDKLVNEESRNKIVEGMKKERNPALNISAENYLKSHLVKYNINFVSNRVEIENNLAEIRHLATGFMMIRREMLEKMMKQYSDTKYTDDVSFLKENENPFAYALFDCGVVDGHYYSEDWLFCERWRLLGGQVFMDVSIQLYHSGQEEFYGNFLSSKM